MTKERMTVTSHPQWQDAERRLRLLSNELSSLTGRQDQLAEQLKQRPAGAAASAADAWDATGSDGGVATMPRVDTAKLREEYLTNAKRIETLLAAQRLGSGRMTGYIDGQRPLQVDLSKACCETAGAEYLDSVRLIRAAVLQVATAVRAAEAILTDLERGGTLIVDPLRRCWNPLGDVRGDNNPLVQWQADLDAYLGEMSPTA